MKNKKKLGLVFVLSALLAYIYFFEIRKENIAFFKKQKQMRIVPFDFERVNKILIHNDYGHYSFFRSANGEWLIDENERKLKADHFVFSRIASFMNESRYIQKLDMENISVLGLNNTSQEISFHINKEKWSISISPNLSFQKQAYLLVKNGMDAEYIYLADARWLTEWNKNLLYFRDKFLISKDTNKIEEVSIMRGEHPIYNLKKNGNDWFYQTKNEKQKVDPSMVYNLLELFTQWSAGDFLDVNSYHQKVGKEKTLLIKYSDNLVDTFYFSDSKKGKSYILNKEKKEAYIAKSSFLDWRLDDYLNRRKPFLLDNAGVKHILYKKDSMVIKEYLKAGEVWQSSAKFSIRSFLQAWAHLRVASYQVKFLVPKMNEELIIKNDDDILIHLRWAPLSMKSSYIVMTNALNSETFLMKKEEWLEIVRFFE